MIDTSELDDFSRDLRAAGEAAQEGGRKVVEKGSLNIKTEARANAPRGPHTPTYYRSITYDVRAGKGWSEGEIGPRHGGPQWGLGNLLEYGGPYNAPHPHLEPALDHEEPRFYSAAEDLAADLEARFG
jgi:hypothetical protein